MKDWDDKKSADDMYYPVDSKLDTKMKSWDEKKSADDMYYPVDSKLDTKMKNWDDKKSADDTYYPAHTSRPTYKPNYDTKREYNSTAITIAVVFSVAALVLHFCCCRKNNDCCFPKNNDSDDHESLWERESVALAYPIANGTLADNESDLPVCIVIPVATRATP